jgi:hypothetical protein
VNSRPSLARETLSQKEALCVCGWICLGCKQYSVWTEEGAHANPSATASHTPGGSWPLRGTKGPCTVDPPCVCTHL